MGRLQHSKVILFSEILPQLVTAGGGNLSLTPGVEGVQPNFLFQKVHTYHLKKVI
jgi:hypothetical protein